MGGNVYCLHYNGYTAFGVDFAEKTARKINEYFLELNVTVGDVRSLGFKNEFFDGYWSLGDISHLNQIYEKFKYEENNKNDKQNCRTIYPHIYNKTSAEQNYL